MKTILVTGGAGYIGSHTCKALAEQGYTPIVYDNLVTGHKEFVKWGPFIEGDIADSAKLKKTFSEHKIDAVMHFAASAYVGESVYEPQKYYENNVIGTLSLLKSMREAGLTKIIFSSTCATYGAPGAKPVDENHLQAPKSPYGFTKLVLEYALRDYSLAYGLQARVLRYFNAAGADPSGELYEWHEPETHLIPNAIRAALDPNYELQLFGNQYDTVDGTCVRDYVHVTDVAAAHVLALKSLEQAPLFDVFNLGCETGTSVLEVIGAVEKCFEKKVKYKVVERRLGDAPILIADSSKAQKLLGWQPQFRTIESIVKSLMRK